MVIEPAPPTPSRITAPRVGRDIHVVADSAYAGEELRKLGKDVTWTTRLRKDAALHGLPPARVPGKKGRPRLRGDRLPSLAGIAAAPTFAQTSVAGDWNLTIQSPTGTRTVPLTLKQDAKKSITRNAMKKTTSFWKLAGSVDSGWKYF